MKLFRYIFLLGCFSTIMTGCVKDDAYTDYSQIKEIILIPNANWPRVATLSTTSVLSTSAEYTGGYKFDLPVRVSWDKPLDKDVVVTFAPSQKAVDDYNALFKTKFTLMPVASYTMPSLKVTIPAGQKTTTNVNIPVTILPSTLDLTKRHMFAMTITDASGEPIATNLATFIMPFTVKNKYDGNYLALNSTTDVTLQSKLTDPANPTATGEYPRLYHINTLAPDKVVLFDPTLNDYLHYYTIGSTGGSYANFAPVFQFDLATDKVIAVTNYYGQPTSGGVGARLIASSGTNDNKYVVTGSGSTAIRRIYVKYAMTVNGADKVTFSEIYQFSAARVY
ncbi:DUF1735 domain-containing protein [Hufsiella ginkgonis]|uniref:DUF1735 domain-containing protein n=1 Tax=Hufsiella ginkgonis TaxID=2695274 RepID=A0A7K1Y4G8_9SPHI|nr:DUF1735 domain-containing protein [Hufsiella ginkgonis]MXV17757.1 DUF1735 domain-containing protein [Hufsiella ginkgonis]